jgi:ribosomal protein L37E
MESRDIFCQACGNGALATDTYCAACGMPIDYAPERTWNPAAIEEPSRDARPVPEPEPDFVPLRLTENRPARRRRKRWTWHWWHPHHVSLHR